MNNIKDSIYDVQSYTDDELYNILELDNPSDRILEAKILSMVNKYSRMAGNMSADMLAKFFIDIYARFFDLAENFEDDSQSNVEGFEAYAGNGFSVNTGLSVPTSNQTIPYGFAPNSVYNIVNGNAVIANAPTPNTPSLNIIQGNAYDINENITKTSTFTNFAGNNQLIDVTGNVISGYTAPKITQTYNVKQVNRAGTLDTSTQNRQGSSTQLTSQLDYTKDTINPILKQTIKRVISIDSQYRDNKNTATTEFTFNLSEPLKDVVSLKLYSVQIPFTWYTINGSFGGNFFYIKGDAEGINNGTHDYQVIVASGNYSASKLVDALQADILRLPSKYNYDVSFGTTAISYGESTVKTTLLIDIKETYGETNYYFDFPTRLLLIDNENPTITLGRYMGFYSNNYDCCSTVSYRKHTPLSITNANIIINGNNDQIQVKTYLSRYDQYGIITNSYNTDSTNPALTTTTIYIPQGTYSVNSLITAINGNIRTSQTTIANSVSVPSFQLSHTFVKLVSITDTTQQDYGNLYIQMNMKLNRNVLQNIDHIKTVVVLPNDTNVWIGPDTAMGFKQINNRLGEIESETQPPRTRYIIKNEVLGNSQLKLECITPQYKHPTNDYTITIPSSQEQGFPIGYRLLNYIEAINQSIVDANGTYRLQNGGVYNPLVDTALNKTVLTRRDKRLDLKVFVQKQFTENDYNIRFTGDWIGTHIYLNGSPITTGTLYDLSTNNTFTIKTLNNSQTYTYNNSDKIEFKSKLPNTQSFDFFLNANADSDILDVMIAEYANLINSRISQIRDHHDQNPFVDSPNGITRAYRRTTTSNDGYFVINMFKKLTTSDYKLTLYSNQSITENGVTNINTWKTYLGFNNSTSTVNSETIVYENLLTTEATKVIENTSNVTTNDLILTEDVTFTMRSFSDIDGLTSTGFYDIPIVLPGPSGNEIERHYIIDEIYEAINTTLGTTQTAVNGATIKGSYIGKNVFTDTTMFRMDISKVFRTKDYNVVFYDPYSFVSCYSGASRKGSQSVQNATWDTTIGWILGFREKIIYYLNDYTDQTVYAAPASIGVTSSLIYYADTNHEQICSLTGDTTVSTSLYNYFLIVLDDYTQNHLNDGLVTITTQETAIDIGPYKYVCDPYLLSGSVKIAVPAGKDYTKMSKRELYTFNQKVLSKKVKEKSYSKGPFVKDIFGIIPIKTSGLAPGSTYVEFGGTLQNQERMYFGPVNIHRMTIRLLNDRGDLVDLNNTNWSFSLVCEQLYKQSL
jgi:hypothetical protein